MKVLITLLITVSLAMSSVAHATNPIPQEIAEQLKTDGYVITYRQILFDYDLKHIIYARHGNLFIISYARWADHMWRWTNDDILEVFIAINQKPHILYTRKPPP